MKLKTLFRSMVAAVVLAAGGQAGAATTDFISGIPNHLDEASFSELALTGAGVRHSPVQWLAASTIITASHHATFIGNDTRQMQDGWLYLPTAMDMEGMDWAMFGAGLMFLGMLARRKMMPRI